MTDPEPGEYPRTKYPNYHRVFNPTTGLLKPDRKVALSGGDRPLTSPYEYDEDIILAVNVALAANRPLLVAGPPGTGKSALAANISKQKDWEFLPKVITGRTEGRDLLWRFDTVRRLHDAHIRSAQGAGDSAQATALPAEDYVEHGVLWEAFEMSSRGQGVVVLIDEIDKADPDVPNSLLEVLGNGYFTFDETGTAKKTTRKIEMSRDTPPFIVITTNDERELSRPFRRRCVTHTIEAPDADGLVKVAQRWNLIDGPDGADGVVARALAKEIAPSRHDGDSAPSKHAGDGAPSSIEPNAGEYLDALRACIDLEIKPGMPEWEAVKRAALLKNLDPEGRRR